jgi:hypothetical protein
VSAPGPEARAMPTQLRAYHPEDRAQLFALLERVWGRGVSAQLEAVWDWRTANNPWSIPGIPAALVMERGGRIIGAITNTATRLKAGDQVVRALWAGEFATDPDHRGHGHSVARRERNLPLPLLGAPNAVSRPVLKAFGFVDVHTLDTRVRILRPERLLEHRAGRAVSAAAGWLWAAARRLAALVSRPPRDGVRVQPLERFDARFDAFWERVAPGYEAIVVRDARHLNWRFVERPDRKYRLAFAERGGRVEGYVTFYTLERHGLRYGHLVDYLVERGDASARDALFAHAVREMEADGADLVTTYVSPHDRFYREGLLRGGFWIRKAGHPILVCDRKKVIDAALLARPDAWFFTRADSDLDIQ